MQRVCYEKSTKRIIEMQSGGDTPTHLQTLIDNAVKAGHAPASITCEFMDDSQYESAQLADPTIQAEKAVQKDKENKMKKAKEDLLAMIATQDASKDKVKIDDILNRLHQIEILINVR
jgi:hypothetical protein